MYKRLLPLLIAVALLAARPARAEDASEAKVHYQKAMAHYAVGEYKEAAGEYEAAFKIKQDPALLYNAAQSHRLAGDNPKALLLYKNLVKLYPSTKYAVEAKDRIEKLEQAIASTQSPPNGPEPVEGAGGPAVPPPPSPPAAPPTAAGPPPAAVEPPPSGAVGAPATTLATTPVPATSDESPPVYKRWWFWAGAGALVVVGVITAVALSSGSSEPWSNVPDVHSGLGPGVRW